MRLYKLKLKPKYCYLLALALLLLFPVIVNNNYILHVTILLGIYLILGTSLNIISGTTGELDLGHAAFFGIGAYTSSLFVQKFIHNFWLGFLAAVIISLIFGLLLGIPSLRIRGDYLAIVTLGFNEIVRYILLNWQNVTNGPMGINSISPPSIFGYVINTKRTQFYLIYAVVFITIIAMNNISRSKFGRALVAIRENEIAASSMGINTGYYKICAFAITAAFAGAAGSLFAHYMSFISPMNFTSDVSILVLCMVTLGGKGSMIGTIIGVTVLLFLPELLRSVAMYRMLIYGLALIFMMIYKPKGIWPEKRKPEKMI